jgi:hypothetical protein
MLQTLPHKTLSQSYPSTFREKENPLHPSKSRKRKPMPHHILPQLERETYTPPHPPTIRERKPMPHHILPQLERENLYPITTSHN